MTESRRRFLVRLGAWVAALALPARAAAARRTVEMICRKAWGAAKPTGEFERHRIRRLTVHHSAVALTDNTLAPQRFRDHQASHQSDGWPDIAYHVLIDRHGNVYEGRPISAIGDTATDYDPRGHLLVMCEGNFEEQSIPAAQVRALVDVLAWASVEYGVGPRTIAGHRDYAATSCPGTALQRLIEEGDIRQRVKKRLAAGGVDLVQICGAEGKGRVAAIEAGTD